MARFFFDSSALVKRYVDEEGTQAVLDLLARAERVVVSRLTGVEITSAVVRRARRVRLGREHVDSILTALDSHLREKCEVLDLARSVVTRATDLARTHALPAADAIQLASALLARGESDPAGRLVLVSSDAELNEAARREGLAVTDPTADSSM